MSVLPIRMLGNPVLREKARSVERFDDSLARLAEDMFETMYEANGVGLAAPQVGVSLQLFVYDDRDEHKGAVVNPTLYSLSGEQVGEEGCLSLPGLYFEVKRALAVTLRANDLDGKPLEFDAEEFLARIVQHETDHVNGILFIDRLSKEDRREAMRRLREQEFGEPQPRPKPARAL